VRSGYRVQFGKLPRGTNDVPGIKLDGVSKQLTVAIKNGNTGE
jgi:hypothetical protein